MIRIFKITLKGDVIKNLLMQENIEIVKMHKYLCFLSVFILSRTKHILTYIIISIKVQGILIILISSAFGFIKIFIIFCIVFIVIYNLQ